MFGFFENLNINTYWARTWTDGLEGDEQSYRGQLDYTGDRYAAQLERLKIGADFDPQIGFVRRRDMVRDFALFKFSPRPRRRGGLIRKYSSQVSLEYVENGARRMETRERALDLGLQFRNADQLNFNYTNSFDFLPGPFEIGRRTILPAGGYDFDNLRFNYNMGQQRVWSANLTAEHGTFYGGHKTTLTAARGRINITSQLSAEPTYSVNRVSLPQGRFTTHLAGSRLTYTMTPLMFVSTLIQYNSGTSSVSTNARLRWEYRPGSELFVVYNEERNTLVPNFPGLSNRALIVKANRLFRF
jgi:hypothetical protein